MCKEHINDSITISCISGMKNKIPCVPAKFFTYEAPLIDGNLRYKVHLVQNMVETLHCQNSIWIFAK